MRKILCMSYVYFNPNPFHKNIGDCAVRACAVATDSDWDTAYVKLALRGFAMRDMPSADDVWGSQLKSEGFSRHIIPDTCPHCYTIKDFCAEHNSGRYVLGTGTHAVAVINGDYYDSWDSGEKVPLYYWQKEE